MSNSVTSKEAVRSAVFGPVISGPTSADDIALARLGKKPALKRNFGLLTILGFSCTVLITWEGSLSVFLSGLQNGGSSGIIYGFIVVWAGTFSIFGTLSELVSMAPTSGGQYHWVSMLAPPSSRKFLGYITGWLTLTGWQTLVASGGYLTGTMIQGLVLLTHPDYMDRMENWHGTLLFWGVVILSYATNSSIGSLLAKFEGFVLVIHILGFFAVILPLTLLGDSASHEAVWNQWLNLGDWQTQGLSFSIGILGNVFAFVGADGAIHMSEEIRNAAVVIPRSLLAGLAVNGGLGFAMVVVTLYFIGDMDTALAENPLYPFMAIFKNAVGSTMGAAFMSAIPVVMAFSATTGLSRIGFANILGIFSRPRGPRLETASEIVLLSLINIGGTAAFNGAISISIAGLFGSCLIAASLLLYRRLTGAISMPDNDYHDDGGNRLSPRLTWGPWRLPGISGVANNSFSCVFLAYILFFSFWPAFKDVTPDNMNWAVLVTGTVLAFSILYYVVWARKVYNGPIVETTYRADGVVNG